MSATQRAGPLSMSSFKALHRNVARHVCSLAIVSKRYVLLSVRMRVLDKLTLKNICVSTGTHENERGPRANNGSEGTQFGFWKREKGVKMRKIKWMKNIRSFLFLLPLKTLCDTHRSGPSVGGPWQRYGTKYRFIACNNTPVIIHNKIKT